MKKMSMLVMALIILTITVFAGAAAVYADEEATTYSVFIYSGKEGYFGEPEVTLKKITGLKYGQEVTVDLSEYDLVVKDPDQYYVRGLKIAGHDNDELSSMQFQSYSFDVEEDVAFSVSYGMTGGMVMYTVNYVDENDNEISESEEFYGMVGDMPVVSYKYIEGYVPQAGMRNLTRMLVDDEDKNVFTFRYTDAESGENGEGGETDDDNGEGGNGGNGGNGANGTGAPGTGIPGIGANDGNDGYDDADNITNLDDGAAPTTDGSGNGKDGETTDIDDQASPLSAGTVAGGIFIFLVLLILILAFIFLKKRKQ